MVVPTSEAVEEVLFSHASSIEEFHLDPDVDIS